MGRVRGNGGRGCVTTPGDICRRDDRYGIRTSYIIHTYSASPRRMATHAGATSHPSERSHTLGRPRHIGVAKSNQYVPRAWTNIMARRTGSLTVPKRQVTGERNVRDPVTDTFRSTQSGARHRRAALAPRERCLGIHGRPMQSILDCIARLDGRQPRPEQSRAQRQPTD